MMTDLTLLFEQHQLSESPEPMADMAAKAPRAPGTAIDDYSSGSNNSSSSSSGSWSRSRSSSSPAAGQRAAYSDHSRRGDGCSDNDDDNDDNDDNDGEHGDGESSQIYQPRPSLAHFSTDHMADQVSSTNKVVDDKESEDWQLSTVPEERSGFQDARPTTPRRSLDSPSSTPAFHPTISPRPRNRSPYSRSHLRAHSSSGTLSAPAMTRAHSLPTVINPPAHLTFTVSPLPRPSSPLRSPARVRSPLKLSDELYPHSGAPSVCNISENSELDLTPKVMTSSLALGERLTASPPALNLSAGNTFPRRRPPSSPLHQVFNTPLAPSQTSSTHSSPLLGATKFNERFPSDIQYSGSFSSSSMPSTPTSTRSRSPSISSLETIPDTPDAEEEAIEADRIARLKAAADKAERGEKDTLRRGSLDVSGPRPMIGFGFGRDKRKRWSVCGAERRGDLDLETIWED